MAVQKQRESNIELFRIITMLLIVAHHYVVNSGLMIPISESPTSAKSLFYLLFGAWGKTGINCFVLITGYFMCKSQVTLRKYLKLILEVYFYRLLFFAVFFVAGKESFSLSRILQIILPFSSITDGFTNCFLAFYLFIPFLNLLISVMNKRQHVALVSLVIFVYTFLATLPKVDVTFNYVTWFVVLYFVGSYLRLYHPVWIERNTGKKLLLIVAVAIISIVILTLMIAKGEREIYSAYYFVSDSNKPFALLIAIFAFTFFRMMKIGYHRFINTIASTTFGILLIHANSDAMRWWLWRETLNNKTMYFSNFGVIHAFLSVIAVFLACSVLDMLRIRFLERPFFRWYDRNEMRMLQAGRNYLKIAYNYVNRGG